MTAEVVVANRGGIALAADSTVTISGPAGGKTYNSVNKLFSLSKHQPVAAMVYGNAQLLEVPWETIFKSHRSQLGENSFPTLGEYGRDLLRFIGESTSLFPEGLRERNLVQYGSRFYYAHVFLPLEKRVREAFEKGDEFDVLQQGPALLDAVIADQQQILDTLARSSLDSAFTERAVDHHRDALTGALSDLFENFPLAAHQVEKLLDLFAVLLAKQAYPESSSGFVVAGFGRNQHFPAVFHCELDLVILDQVRHNVLNDDEIGPDNPGFILPCAQRDVVDTFISGAHPLFQTAFRGFLEGALHEMTEVVAPQAGDPEVAASIRDGGRDVVERFVAALDSYLRNEHIDPMLQAVKLLPKDELAALAEALVNLTSIKRKVALELETVGGPIDVAVISKGDGLIWIRRKHYFDGKLNHQFFAGYYNE